MSQREQLYTAVTSAEALPRFGLTNILIQCLLQWRVIGRGKLGSGRDMRIENEACFEAL